MESIVIQNVTFTSCLGNATNVTYASSAVGNIGAVVGRAIDAWRLTGTGKQPGTGSTEVFGPYSSYIAVGIVVAAAVLSGAGGVMQKLAHRRSSKPSACCPRPLTGSTCCLMTTGTALAVLAALLDLAALMFGNITLVVPLGSLKLVVTAVLSATCFGHHMQWWDALWLACLVVGCGLAVYFSVPRVCIFTLQDLRDLYVL